MAITWIEYELLRKLRDDGLLPSRPAVIEFGESNWYDDVPIDQLEADIEKYADPEERNSLRAELQQVRQDTSHPYLFKIANICYRCLLRPEALLSIDLMESYKGLRLDLNEPLPDGLSCDLLLNLGTAEHVFDIRRFFTNAHNVTAGGGLMVHGVPSVGWIEHGFYNFQPTFMYDLAAANNYVVVAGYCTSINPRQIIALDTREAFLKLAQSGGLPSNAMIHFIFRKPETESPFRVPFQGYYSGQMDPRLKQAWHWMR